MDYPVHYKISDTVHRSYLITANSVLNDRLSLFIIEYLMKCLFA